MTVALYCSYLVRPFYGWVPRDDDAEEISDRTAKKRRLDDAPPATPFEATHPPLGILTPTKMDIGDDVLSIVDVLRKNELGAKTQAGRHQSCHASENGLGANVVGVTPLLYGGR
jgi:hypothetical protein